MKVLCLLVWVCGLAVNLVPALVDIQPLAELMKIGQIPLAIIIVSLGTALCIAAGLIFTGVLGQPRRTLRETLPQLIEGFKTKTLEEFINAVSAANELTQTIDGVLASGTEKDIRQLVKKIVSVRIDLQLDAAELILVGFSPEKVAEVAGNFDSSSVPRLTKRLPLRRGWTHV